MSLDHDELHRLIDQLAPGQAEAVRAVVLELVRAGPADDDPDLAERSEDILTPNSNTASGGHLRRCRRSG